MATILHRPADRRRSPGGTVAAGAVTMPGGDRPHGAIGAVSQQEPTQARPAQVTVACLVIVVGSVFVVLLMWDRIANLHDVATRRAIQDFLGRSDLGGSGLGVADLITVVKVISMVTAACAVVTAVQGWQA